MTSDRVQRRIDRLLEQADEALDRLEWGEVRGRAQAVLNLDPANKDALTYLAAASRGLREHGGSIKEAAVPSDSTAGSSGLTTTPATPSSFANGRYQVKRFLGEGGKKRVYLAHDTLLDRDVAFALIKTEGLDDTGRDRIRREAQAMGRLGSHPHIVSVFDLGEEPDGQPFIVTELMGGGDVEGLIESAPEHRPTLERALEIGIQVCRGLEFAHSHGIVHRDLKPGNVWLTADGTAKLGDFGLAVALDRSRLTQAGMMVGTVSYMPPEQAMGGEVTPRSDLYSLGSMLYELITGRPPFVGDESVAIIGQHLNTPPVAPTWHRPDCPPGLEALILRLLEKDPSRRPASASEVREALSSISFHSSSSTSLPDDDEGAEPADNPLYRRAFVGRESELRSLHAAFDAALSGRGSLAMVVGEPGIGKTSVCEQLATYATLRGGKTLVGHCYEEGSLSLPYMPFVEAMRSYVLAREPDGLKSDLGSGAGEVARIVSEVRDRVQVSPAELGDPEEQRWRLLQAVTGFLRNASTVQPIVIILEDLHDADRGTLDLLVHLSRNLVGARLLIIGTYRDVEVDRGHPLSSALAELRRGQNFLRVPLRGLTAEEVQRMMAAVAQREIPWPFGELVHRQTEGNPLFVQEMLRYLVEEGLVAEQGGRLQRVGDDTLAGRIPEGLRDVIGKRLSRLADKTNQVLSIASVVGREFRLDVLQQVANLPSEDVETALEEASAIAVVEQRTGVGGQLSFRFTHAFFRQTLYEELFAARRIRLHQQVARALEAVYGRRVDEHATELAEHYSNSSDPADLGKAVAYGEVAAKRAMAVFAYGEAARHLDQALKAQDVLDPDDKLKRCDLLLGLGEALLPAGEPQQVVGTVAPEALELAKALSDATLASRACQAALRGCYQLGGGAALFTSEYRGWVKEADRWAAPQSLDRVYADLALAFTRIGQGEDGVSFWESIQHGLGVARSLNDHEAQFRCAELILGQGGAAEHEAERLRLTDETAAADTTGVSLSTLGTVRLWSFRPYLAWGRRQEAEAALAEAKAIAERTRDNALIVRCLSQDAVLLLFDGRLEEAVQLGDSLRAHGNELGVPGIARVQRAVAVSWPLLHLGRPAEALADQAGYSEPVLRRGNLAGIFAFCLAQLGRIGEAQADLDDLRERWRAGGKRFAPRLQQIAAYLPVAVLLEDHELTRMLREHLAPVAGMLGHPQWTCIARHLGAASRLLGELEQARAYYLQAIEVCEKVRFRPELALSRLDLAELLLANYPNERADATEHLEFAISEFREMKMQPSLERALRHKEVLKA